MPESAASAGATRLTGHIKHQARKEKEVSDEVIKQVMGACEAIEQKPGSEWTRFLVNVGRQYPVKLDTKLPDVMEAAHAAGAQQAVWTWKEIQGGPNPHKPGEFFTNRWLTSVEVGGTLDPSLATTQVAHAHTPTSGGKSPDERVSIERQVVIKACVPIYAVFADDDTFFAFCERCAGFIAGAPNQHTQTVSTPPAPAPTASAEPYDDVPF
jgi:hypothetical protein